MNLFSKLVAAFLLFLSLVSCFTLHSPSYLVSANDAILLIGAPRVEVTVSRNYVLAFGGFNKQPMMAEARAALSKKYGGFLPYALNNIAVDEEKTSVFLLYNRHRLFVTANMVLADEATNLATNRAVESVKKYDFAEGDRVYFDFKDSYGNYKLSGTISGFLNKLANIDLDDKSNAKHPHLKLAYTYVALKDLQLLSKDNTDNQQNDTVDFVPRGYNGAPFSGMVHDFYNNNTVMLKLTPDDLERWKGYDGEVDGNGIIYVPTYRVFK